MFDLTEDFDNFLKKHGFIGVEEGRFFDRERIPECRKRVEDLSKGVTSLNKSLCDEMDELNRLTRDMNDIYDMCPAYHSKTMMDMNSFFDVKYCPHMEYGTCFYMSAVNQDSEEIVGAGRKLLFNFHIEGLDAFDLRVLKRIEPKVRVHLMDIYDRYRAASMPVRLVEGINEFACTAWFDRLKAAEKIAEKEFWSAFNDAYKSTSDNYWNQHTFTEEEYEAAYEEYQYEERKRLGEPVIFYNGRCYFEGYIASYGYIPGAFPGLDLYTRQGKQVDPQQFAQWLAEKKIERQLSNLPPVGFFGHPVCGVRAADIFRFCSKRLNCTGSATMRLYLTDPQLHFRAGHPRCVIMV